MRARIIIIWLPVVAAVLALDWGWLAFLLNIVWAE